MLRGSERHAREMRHDAVSTEIAAAVSDLLFLSELNELRPFLVAAGQGHREPIAFELAAFARRRAVYEGIRILSSQGMELLRVDYVGPEPAAAPMTDLRYEGNAIYMHELTRCGEGTIYISSFETITSDHGGHPMSRLIVRLGQAIRAGGDGIAGYLMLDLRGSVVLRAFHEAHPDSRTSAFLLDASGEWLRASETGFGPGGPHELDQSLRDAWNVMSSGFDGQFASQDGLFTFGTLMPYGEAEDVRCEILEGDASSGHTDPTWKSVSWASPSLLQSMRSEGRLQLIGWNVLGVLALGGGSWAIGRRLSLRAALHERTAQERELLQSTLKKYMSTEIRERVLRHPERHAGLGGESQDVVVLFADIRGFTRFAEERHPEDVVSVLNRTMSEITVPLRTYGGILDKYLGDGFLAFFEAAAGLNAAVDRAVQSARMMQRVFRNLWGDMDDPSLRRLGLGIGISAGRVVIGNVGTADAMDYTIVGDAVNVASRLQSIAGSGEILVSKGAFDLLPNPQTAVAMPRVSLRGRQCPIDVYRLTHV